MILRSDLESALASAVRELPDLELRVLAKMATRLVYGSRKYGSLSNRMAKVDWKTQANEEFLDACFYLTVETMDDA